MKNFRLYDYLKEIKGIAEANNCGAAQAVDLFVVNLTTMSDHHKGAPNLNFRELGQAWNRLGYRERNKQKEAATVAVAKEIRMPRARMEV